MTRSKLIIAALTIATALPSLSILASTSAAANPCGTHSRGPNMPCVNYTRINRIPASYWSNYRVQHQVNRFRVR